MGFWGFGVLGGLVGITAGADQMGPTEAIIIGIVGGVIVVLGVALLDKCKLDDPPWGFIQGAADIFVKKYGVNIM